ncbi:SRPBCC domain-containing protein [Agrococcus sp. ARC_14]|uniref:SRPBCC domain-containing protein n=1 Tax=Agrococcus sp. ARC_14 TaxID=2919927 RepID=UPI001F057078|nr:SRPBCC domain-containing protein [Agrococcus sp. ARC_14]MCH1884332.1 SRPBCC domain-containing protein [Agrococcus sp. ARC_14]
MTISDQSQIDPRQIDPALDLTIQRIIRAPRRTVWNAWTDPSLLAQWWVPAPTIARVDRLEVRPGGGFVTQMSDDGEAFVPHTDGIFLVVEQGQRLVFTNAIRSSWHPAEPAPVAMTAEILLGEHAEGTDYRVIVRHRAPADREQHEQLGFFEGWGAVTEALATLAEASERG